MPKLKKKLLKKLSNGEIAIKYTKHRESVKLLNKILKKAFPKDKFIVVAPESGFFFLNKNKFAIRGLWDGSSENRYKLPEYHLEDFVKKKKKRN